jgi:hypothetical protein
MLLIRNINLECESDPEKMRQADEDMSNSLKRVAGGVICVDHSYFVKLIKYCQDNVGMRYMNLRKNNAIRLIYAANILEGIKECHDNSHKVVLVR